MLKKAKKIGFLGIGISNISLMALPRFRDLKITLRSRDRIDLFSLPRGLRIDRVFIGRDHLRDIDEDILFLSPSVKRDTPELVSAKERGVILCSDAELFFKENNYPVYAVTGSDGKSTTATLTHMLLREAGEINGLIGNIGEPMVRNLGRYESYVAELSSFMLEALEPRSERACITNITPNHLDFHGSFDKYRETKLKALKNARQCVLPEELGDAFCVIGSDYSTLKKKRKAEVYITCEGGYVRRNGEILISLDDIKRNEPHNIKNLMMAIGMTDGKVGKDEILSVARRFSGLAHRCQLILSKNGVDYYDSSIDSTPERTAQTLEPIGIARRSSVSKAPNKQANTRYNAHVSKIPPIPQIICSPNCKTSHR